MKEREGNYSEAVNLYLKAGLPAKAARLAMSQEVIDKYHYQVAWNCCRYFQVFLIDLYGELTNKDKRS